MVPVASWTQMVPVANWTQMIPVANWTQVVPVANWTQMVPVANWTQMVPVANWTEWFRLPIGLNGSSCQLDPESTGFRLFQLHMDSNGPQSIGLKFLLSDLLS